MAMTLSGSPGDVVGVEILSGWEIGADGNFLCRPLTLLSKTLLGTARSSLFLSTYCASAWLLTCWTFRALGICNPALVAIGTFPAGLAVLLEKKSRRMELALYCFSMAIESFGICESDSGVLKEQERRIPDRIDVVLFSLATSIIMHCYAAERNVFRSKYLDVLDWIFGIPDPSKSAAPLENKSNDVSIDEKSQQYVAGDYTAHRGGGGGGGTLTPSRPEGPST